jgi:NAD-dependent SIR2 family protein deacetylase
MAVKWPADGSERHGPSWAELVDEAARKLGFEKPDLLRVRGTDLQILEYFRIRQQGSFAALTNWLYKEMSPPDDALEKSLIHRELAKLERCRIFYTTNFDDLLERAFKLNKRPYRRVAVEAHMYGSTEQYACEIIKFHGDLEYPDRMVLSESDYQRRLTLQSDMEIIGCVPIC